LGRVTLPNAALVSITAPSDLRLTARRFAPFSTRPVGRFQH
jgi:hypothetical protein